MISLMAHIQGRSGFGLSYRDVLELPLSLRDDMLEQIEEWRSQERSAEAKVR